eukprot:GHVO01011734.1.p1 GENE.GHVO01011734.1~~GHVO01011734.1.p1  ORF type:complete len:337 (+),score=44.92 GHVO01011734.1:227-1237(+)
MYALSERIIAADAVSSLLDTMYDDVIGPPGCNGRVCVSDSDMKYIEEYIRKRKPTVAELRGLMHDSTALSVLDRQSMIDGICNIDFRKGNTDNFNSALNPILFALQNSAKDVHRRLLIAGGGSIPHQTQRQFWNSILKHCCTGFVTALSKIKFLPLQASGAPNHLLFIMAERFRETLSTINNMLPGEGDVETQYLDAYIQAHGYTSSELLAWCKNQLAYHVSHLTAIIMKNEKMQIASNRAAEVEMWYCQLLQYLKQNNIRSHQLMPTKDGEKQHPVVIGPEDLRNKSKSPRNREQKSTPRSTDHKSTPRSTDHKSTPRSTATDNKSRSTGDRGRR